MFNPLYQYLDELTENIHRDIVSGHYYIHNLDTVMGKSPIVVNLLITPPSTALSKDIVNHSLIVETLTKISKFIVDKHNKLSPHKLKSFKILSNTNIQFSVNIDSTNISNFKLTA